MAFGKIPAVMDLVAGVSLSDSSARRMTARAGVALESVEEAEVRQIERECPASPIGPGATLSAKLMA